MRITEKVSPMHPDKIADRIAGALVDYCYTKDKHPKCAFEVIIGHQHCCIIAETSVSIPKSFIEGTVRRISKLELCNVDYHEVPQDFELAKNQFEEIRCGDNGVFAGYPMPDIHIKALDICKKLYNESANDGKIVLNNDTNELTICWSNIERWFVQEIIPEATKINPLGDWTGGVNVDTGVTGRKLANDFYGIEYPLGGGNMCGKDLSKADVSVNIYCFLKAQETGKEQKAICSIGDTMVNINGEMIPYYIIVHDAHEYIKKLGGFEKLAEWGLQKI